MSFSGNTEQNFLKKLCKICFEKCKFSCIISKLLPALWNFLKMFETCCLGGPSIRKSGPRSCKTTVKCINVMMLVFTTTRCRLFNLNHLKAAAQKGDEKSSGANLVYFINLCLDEKVFFFSLISRIPFLSKYFLLPCAVGLVR